MSSSNLIRLGGLAALLGAVLLIISSLWRTLAIGRPGDYVLSEAATTWTWVAVQGVSLLGLALLLVGLVGLYARQAEDTGILGLVGFLLLLIGAALALGTRWFDVFVLPDAAAAAPEWVDANTTGWAAFGFDLTDLLAVPGWLLFAVATLRAGVYPRAAVITLLIGAVIALLPLYSPSSLVRNAAVAWLGVALLTGRVASREEPAPFMNLARWGAPAAGLTGVALIVSDLIGVIALVLLGQGREETFGTPSFYLVEGVSLIALVCMLGGLVGLHALQETSYGRLGLAGFFLAFVGTALALDVTSDMIGAGREVANSALLLGSLGWLVGFVLLGVAALRSKVLPWWCGVSLIVGLPLAVGLTIPLGNYGGGILFGLVWLALGYALWGQRGELDGQPSLAGEVPGKELLS